MQLTFLGQALAQEHKPAKGTYPASVDISFTESGTGKQFVLNSPVAIDPALLETKINWIISGFAIAQIPYVDKSGNQKHFLKLSCTSVTGQVVK